MNAARAARATDPIASTPSRTRLAWRAGTTFALCVGLTAIGMVAAAPAHAADHVITDEASLLAAVAAASDGDRFIMGGSFTSTAEIDLGATVTIDLGDHDVTVDSIHIGEGKTLRLEGGTGTLRARPADGDRAAIGTSRATFIMASGNLVAHSPDNSGAAIGGWVESDAWPDISSMHGGTVIVLGGSITAVSDRSWGAAIGGALRGNGGDVTVYDGTVVAIGSFWSPAIGAAGNAADPGAHAGTFTMHGGDVTVSIESWLGPDDTTMRSAAIGTGINGAPLGPIVHILGGTLTGTNMGAGAVIGGGAWQNGGEIVIGENATVHATGRFATLGSGGGNADRPSMGSLTINGNLIVDGPLRLRSGDTMTVGETGVISGPGRLYGPGTVTNLGAIQLDDVRDVGGTLTITDNNFLVTFDAGDGTELESVRVLAPTFAAGARAFPAEPTHPDDPSLEFAGWLDADGIPLTPTTVLESDLTVTAAWTEPSPADVPPINGTELPPTGIDVGPLAVSALGLLAAGLLLARRNRAPAARS